MNSSPTVTIKRRHFAVWCVVMVSLHAAFLGAGFSQQSFPDLSQIKTAAEAGNARAQDTLAGNYLFRMNFSAAAKWYEKAAKQGVVNSQWHLGQILLGGRPKVAEGSVAVPQDKDAAIRWLLMAANQGHGGAQLDIGRCYEKGDGIKQDYVEAYKWYRLASQQYLYSLAGKSYLDPLILRLTSQQIQEGQRRADDFSPGKTQVEPPSLLDKLVLKGISGAAGHRLAVINNKTVELGETAEVKVGESTVKVRCLEIRETSVLVRVEGLEGPRELHMKQ